MKPDFIEIRETFNYPNANISLFIPNLEFAAGFKSISIEYKFPHHAEFQHLFTVNKIKEVQKLNITAFQIAVPQDDVRLLGKVQAIVQDFDLFLFSRLNYERLINAKSNDIEETINAYLNLSTLYILNQKL